MEQRKNERNVLKFRDFEMDEDDFIILEDILLDKLIDEEEQYSIERFDDPFPIFFVPNAVANGMVQVGQYNNNDKRITGITKFFMEQTKIEPEELEDLDALQSHNLDCNCNLEENRKRKRNIDNDPARNILKFRNFEMDEDDFRILGKMFLNNSEHVDTVPDAIRRSTVKVEDENNNDKRVTYFKCGLDTDLRFREGRMPREMAKLDGLRALNFNEYDQLLILPDELGQLQNLVHLDLEKCHELTTIPSSIGNLIHLNRLNLEQCTRLVELPSTIGDLESLETLRINLAALKRIPYSIGRLSNLKELYALDQRYYEQNEIERQWLTESTINPLLTLCNIEKLEISVQDLGHFKENTFSSFQKVKELILDWNVDNYSNAPTNSITLPTFPSLEKLKVDYYCNEEGFDYKQHPARFNSHWLPLLPELRELIIEFVYPNDGVSSPYVSLLGLRNLKKLEVVKLSRCEVDGTTTATTNNTRHTFSALRELVISHCCSGRINFLEFDLPNIEIIDLSVDPDKFKFGVVKSSETKEDDQKRYFHLHDLGICPNLINLSISYWNTKKCTLHTGISYQSLALFPSIQKVYFRNCNFEFFDSPMLSPSVPHQEHSEQLISIPTLKDITLSRCDGLFRTNSDMLRLNLKKLQLPSLEIFRFIHDLDLTNNRMGQVLTNLLPICKNLTILNFVGCCITEISSGIILKMPQKLSILDLTENPIFSTASGRDSLRKLLHRCNNLGFLGRVHPNIRMPFNYFDTANETSPDEREAASLGYLMSINRAHSRVLSISSGLWSVVLQNAPNAFKKDNFAPKHNESDLLHDNAYSIEEHHDAIYQLLRERAAVQIFCQEM